MLFLGYFTTVPYSVLTNGYKHLLEYQQNDTVIFVEKAVIENKDYVVTVTDRNNNIAYKTTYTQQSALVGTGSWIENHDSINMSGNFSAVYTDDTLDYYTETSTAVITYADLDNATLTFKNASLKMENDKITMIDYPFILKIPSLGVIHTYTGIVEFEGGETNDFFTKISANLKNSAGNIIGLFLINPITFTIDIKVYTDSNTLKDL